MSNIVKIDDEIAGATCEADIQDTSIVPVSPIDIHNTDKAIRYDLKTIGNVLHGKFDKQFFDRLFRK